MCLGFKNVKIDPRFFDPRWVFMETLDPLATADTTQVGTVKKSLVEHLKSRNRKHRSGPECASTGPAAVRESVDLLAGPGSWIPLLGSSRESARTIVGRGSLEVAPRSSICVFVP